ncbi:S-adenosylmethionine decarboxylase [Streptomyces sp. NPDC049881]|uniref:S-adenosylmethionine decarboxylase n=1 Tax=unclassified Streptomyces TaxID=2593676 RepID=UPI0034140AC6
MTPHVPAAGTTAAAPPPVDAPSGTFTGTGPGGGEMSTYAVDLWVADPAVLTDEPLLLHILRTAAAAGGATVLGEATHVFPNGAVTAILLLSASHISVHTWPEHRLAHVDVLAYGRGSGARMVASVEAALAPVRVTTARVPRAVGP